MQWEAVLESWGERQETAREAELQSYYSSAAELNSPRADDLWAAGWVRPVAHKVWFLIAVVSASPGNLTRNADSQTLFAPNLLSQKPRVKPISL